MQSYGINERLSFLNRGNCACEIIASSSDAPLATCSPAPFKEGWNHHAFVFSPGSATWFINGNAVIRLNREFLPDWATLGNTQDLSTGDSRRRVCFKRVSLFSGALDAEQICSDFLQG